MPARELPQQTPEQVAAAIAAFLEAFPAAVVLEDGKVLFDLSEAKYTCSTDHGRCTLQLWAEGNVARGNMVRRVVAAETRAKILRLSTVRFGQAKPVLLELAGDRDRRTPSAREAVRLRYVKVLERTLERHFEGWRAEAFRTAMDLEKSFGPAYARGLLVRGNQAWAVIGCNAGEALPTMEGILTFGILWLAACRAQGGGRRLVQGLRVVLPRGLAALTLSRMAWLAGGAQWELLECDEREETLETRDPADHGNVRTRLLHAPDLARAQERFAAGAARILALVPEAFRAVVEPRVRSATELAFLLHGMEFARVRLGTGPESFNRIEEATFGTGANETPLTAEAEPELRELVAQLCTRRSASGEKRDPLYRMQPERWLEGRLRDDLGLLDKSLSGQTYSQVPAFAAADRGMLDLLAVADDGRLAVIEVKADEDPQLALQGLDYWLRVRWHHAQNPDPATGLGEFQRHGYFGGVRLSPEPPRLLLVAPALRIHPATEIVLRHLSPRVEWTLLALDERWRDRIKVVWRKRSTDPEFR